MPELLTGRSPAQNGSDLLDLAESDPTQSNDHLRAGTKIGEEPAPAGSDLDRARAVLWRSASDDGGDQAVSELETVIAMHRRRLIGKAGIEQRPKEPVARTIAGEDAPGAIATVGSGSQPDDDQASFGITEGRNRTGPIDLVAEGRPLLLADSFPPLDEARAKPAVDQSQGLRAPTLTSLVAFHSIQPSPRSSASSIWARTCSSV